MCCVSDTVLYGLSGICRIVEITNRNFNGTEAEYYVLKPIYDEKSTIFVQTHSDRAREKMRRVLSAEEIGVLLKAMPDQNTIWVEDEKARKEVFKQVLSGGDRIELVKMIRSLYLRQESQKEKGKKTHVADEQSMKDAEKILYEEFAHVLNIKREQVLPFILEQIRIEEKKRA